MFLTVKQSNIIPHLTRNTVVCERRMRNHYITFIAICYFIEATISLTLANFNSSIVSSQSCFVAAFPSTV